jgi:elongation factor Ts
VDDSLEELTKGLCQHIIASSPTSIGSLSDKPSANKQDETRLLFQEYALNEDVTIKEILEDNDVKLNDFVRFECGEILPDENV